MKKRIEQNGLDLFSAGPALPEGFKYQREIISPDDEQSILRLVRELPFQEFDFHGFLAKRRVVSYGWQYDFSQQALRKADDIPDWLLWLREAAARFAEMEPSELQQVLILEYDVGAAIGWHRDKAVFGDVIGISLLSSARFRMRRKVGPAWERRSLTVEPRSAYLLRGPARTEWEHSIPAVDALRYSITYRSFQARS